MQTPLLFTPQAAQKNLAEVANKNESNVNKMNADSGKTPFQMALDQKVRTKQGSSQPNQAQTAPIQNKKVQTASVTEKKVAADQQAVQLELTDSQIDKKAAKQLATGQEDLLGLTEPKLDSDPTKFSTEIKDEIEIIPEDDLNSVIALIAPIALEPAKNNVLINAKELLGAAREPTSDKQSLVLDDTLELNESADLVDNAITIQNTKFSPALAASLASGKNPNFVGQVVANQSGKLGPVLEGTLASTKPNNLLGNDVADIHAQVDQVLDHSRWSSDVTGKVMSEDISATKMTLNAAKDGMIKEMMVTSTLQPQVAQVQSQLAAQQVVQPLVNANIINVYPGKSGWDQAISQKVMWMVGAGEQSASLTLNPPDLGPLKVVINVHNNQADTTFISDNDEVRRALESGLSHLRDKMSESGVQLGQTNISSSSQSQQQFEQAAQNRVLAQAQAKISENLHLDNVVSSPPIVRIANGLVDTFA